MASNTVNYRRVAKNTLMLYIRMIFVMLASLVTVRILLSALGQEDYGIYNVVGGIVVMFSFLSHTLSSASQRFYSYHIGKGDTENLKIIYTSTILLYIIVIAIIFVMAETVGLWFLNNHMTIPPERLLAANIIYQFSIFSFCWKIFTAAHQALIIAYERMSVYAYVSVAEVVLQLGIVFMLKQYNYDRLILYGALIFASHLLTNGYYIVYARRKIGHVRLSFKRGGGVMKEIISYTSWTLIGMLALAIRSSGINIVLNVFFNPIVNAARGIAYTVNSVVTTVTGNFYTAVRPQIVKSYSKTLVSLKIFND